MLSCRKDIWFEAIIKVAAYHYQSMIIPVETQTREFDAKLFLACVAAEQGYEVFLGSRSDIHLRIAAFPRSIYLAKDIKKSYLRILNILKNLGHVAFALDEEALIYYSKDIYQHNRLDGQTMARLSGLFAWGPENEALWREYDSYPGTPIYQTGNPRLDLMRPELRAFYEPARKAIEEQFGPFLLLNSNFGKVNHFFSKLSTHRYPQKKREWKRLIRQGVDPELVAFRSELFDQFLQLVPALAEALPECTLVVRPHPAEQHAAWQRAAGNSPNVQVLHEGSVVPWLMAASAIIHNGCTTGLEGHLLGRPVFSYQPVIHGVFDTDLANQLSHTAHNAEDLIHLAKACLAGDYVPPAALVTKRAALLTQHICGLEGPFSAERILEAMNAFHQSAKEADNPHPGASFKGYISARWRQMKKRVNSLLPVHKNSASYTRHRFPGLSLADVEAKMADYQFILRRFSGLEVSLVSSNIFRIRQKGGGRD